MPAVEESKAQAMSDDLKPVAPPYGYLYLWDGWCQFESPLHGDPLPADREWDDEPPAQTIPLYTADAIESLRRDAERYRWLRTRMTWRQEQRGMATNRTAPVISYAVRVWYHETSDQEHNTIDAAIDAAIEARKA
jgi:hypothetical protein